MEVTLNNSGKGAAVLKSVSINENDITRYRVLSDISKGLTELCVRCDYEKSLKDCTIHHGQSLELFKCTPPSKIKSKTQLTEWRNSVKEALRLMDASAEYRSEDHHHDTVAVEYADSEQKIIFHFEGKFPGILHENEVVHKC